MDPEDETVLTSCHEEEPGRRKTEDRVGYGSGCAQERNKSILGESGLWAQVAISMFLSPA